jgi:hypothetical protein
MLGRPDHRRPQRRRSDWAASVLAAAGSSPRGGTSNKGILAHHHKPAPAIKHAPGTKPAAKHGKTAVPTGPAKPKQPRHAPAPAGRPLQPHGPTPAPVANPGAKVARPDTAADDGVFNSADESKYFVKGGQVYFADGAHFGPLTHRDVIHALKAHPERIVILRDNVRLGRNVSGPIPQPEGDQFWVDQPVMGPHGRQMHDGAGNPLTERSTELINVGSFTIRAENVSEFGIVHVRHSVYDGDGKWIGTWEQRKDLILRNSAAKVNWIGSPPPDVHHQKVAAGNTAPSYLLGRSVDAINTNGANPVNVLGTVLGVVTGPFEVSFHYGDGTEFRSPFGAFYDSVTGRHPFDDGVVLVNVEGLDNNFDRAHAQWVADHYDVIRDGTAAVVKTAVTVLVKPFNPAAATFVGAGVSAGFVKLGESLADYDMGKKQKGDLVKDVVFAIAKAEAAELAERWVSKLPLPPGAKARIAAKAAKGVVNIATDQAEIWLTPCKAGESAEAALERRKKESLVIALADVEKMAIDIIAEGVPQSDVVKFFNVYAKSVVKGLAAGFTKSWGEV